MIIVDYPPGGLGNFIAQILTNTVRNPKHVSFHRNIASYDIKLLKNSDKEFLSVLESWKPKGTVAISHSFGAIGAAKTRFDCKIISVRAKQYWPQLYLNLYMKASADDPYHQENSYEWYYRRYQNLINTWSYPEVDEILNFDEFYQDATKFYQVVTKLNPKADAHKIYDIFCTTQKPVLDKMIYLKQIADTLGDVSHLNNFDQALVTILKESK